MKLFDRNLILAMLGAEVLLTLLLHRPAQAIPDLFKMFFVLEFLAVAALARNNLRLSGQNGGKLPGDMQKRTSFMGLAIIALCIVAMANPSAGWIWIAAFALIAAAKAYYGQGARRIEVPR